MGPLRAHSLHSVNIIQFSVEKRIYYLFCFLFFVFLFVLSFFSYCRKFTSDLENLCKINYFFFRNPHLVARGGPCNHHQHHLISSAYRPIIFISCLILFSFVSLLFLIAFHRDPLELIGLLLD